MTVVQLAFISVGGVIGAGFFLGSGVPVEAAGPSVLIAFLLGGLATAHVVGALTTMAVNHPAEGSFKAYADLYIGPFAGFLQGWVYYVASILTISSEAVAMSIFTHLWLPDIPTWLTASAYALVILVINAFGVSGFDRAESLMSVVKIAAMIGLIIFLAGEWLIRTSGPAHSVAQGGFFPHGFSGLLQAMLIVIFAYAGIGVFGTAATQVENPRTIDRGAWITMLALVILYTLSIGLLLLSEPWQQVNTSASPFVLALARSGAPFLAPVFNAVILVASFSVMAGSVYSANQILASLGEEREGPSFATYTAGPRHAQIGALAVTACCVAGAIGISYLLPDNVYSFLISASSFCNLFMYALILWSFLRWRKSSQTKRKRLSQKIAAGAFSSRLSAARGRHESPSRQNIHTGNPVRVHDRINDRSDRDAKISSLAFGQPATTYITLLFFLILSAYALWRADQRTGFYAFLAIIAVFSIAYLLLRRRRAPRIRP
ncbi:MAG: amino acid permease [Bacilli bacterium]